MEKVSKQLLLKGVVVFVLGLVGAYIGKDLVSGETLATVDNIIAGGIGATSLATLGITLLIQNVLPKSTGTQVANSIVPIITDSNKSLEEKFEDLKGVVINLVAIITAQEEARQALLNEDNEA